METSLERIAQQISRTGSFDLPCSADTAFPLFSPEGERGWIKEWIPRPVFPETIEFRGDTVFREGESNEEAVWTIVDVDWQTHRAEYVRVAAASHAAHIVVKIDPVGQERCRVAVNYSVTVFGTDRERMTDAFSESAYAEKMRNWQRQISDYLRDASRAG